jgi:hypothetical protein
MKPKLLNQENVEFLKTIKIGNSTIDIYQEVCSEEKRKQNLIKIYDAINEIARSAEKRGVDTSSWFYTDEQIEKMKKDSKYNFI